VIPLERPCGINFCRAYRETYRTDYESLKVPDCVQAAAELADGLMADWKSRIEEGGSSASADALKSRLEAIAAGSMDEFFDEDQAVRRLRDWADRGNFEPPSAKAFGEYLRVSASFMPILLDDLAKFTELFEKMQDFELLGPFFMLLLKLNLPASAFTEVSNQSIGEFRKTKNPKGGNAPLQRKADGAVTLTVNDKNLVLFQYENSVGKKSPADRIKHTTEDELKLLRSGVCSSVDQHRVKSVDGQSYYGVTLLQVGQPNRAQVLQLAASVAAWNNETGVGEATPLFDPIDLGLLGDDACAFAGKYVVMTTKLLQCALVVFALTALMKKAKTRTITDTPPGARRALQMLDDTPGKHPGGGSGSNNVGGGGGADAGSGSGSRQGGGGRRRHDGDKVSESFEHNRNPDWVFTVRSSLQKKNSTDSEERRTSGASAFGHKCCGVGAAVAVRRLAGRSRSTDLMDDDDGLLGPFVPLPRARQPLSLADSLSARRLWLRDCRAW
jgi:hypothetical protein